jgi:hypothetical protein
LPTRSSDGCIEEQTLAYIVDIEKRRSSATGNLQRLSCYCDAARMAREHFGGQLRELHCTVSKPRVLCLERLEGGIPAIPGGWELIYSTGLFTNLPESAARQVLKSAVARLAPGGRLLIANVRSGRRLDSCPHCRTTGNGHRDEIDMIAMASELPSESASGQLISRDDAGLNVYLELHRSASSLDVPQLQRRERTV